MTKKIQVTQYGFVHYHAFCRECNFECAIHSGKTKTRQDIRNTVRKHVLKTGHTVTIEGGNSTRYKLLEIS